MHISKSLFASAGRQSLWGTLWAVANAKWYISTYIAWEKITQKKNQLGLSRAPIQCGVVWLGQRGVFGGGCGQAGRVRDILPPHHRSSAHPIHSSSTSHSLSFFHSVASFLFLSFFEERRGDWSLFLFLFARALAMMALWRPIVAVSSFTCIPPIPTLIPTFPLNVA